MSAGEYLERALRALGPQMAGPGSAEAAGVHALELARALAPLVAKVHAQRAEVKRAEGRVLGAARSEDYSIEAAQSNLMLEDDRLEKAERALVLALCGAGE